jgi:dTDP-glucose pyrophosphorylase
MKVLITMAGRGSRFQEVGVSKPKHEIMVEGQPMFDWAMRSLQAFFDKEFIFVTQSEHNATTFLKDACDRLGISNTQEVIIEDYTSGQAQTAIKANKYIDSNDAVAIYNIDTYIEEGELAPQDISGDGFIPVFTDSGDRWSFVRTNDDGYVIDVSEKKKISDIATAGFYYFDHWEDFVSAYKNKAQQVERKYGETYIAPLYNHLIDERRTILPYQLDKDSIHVLGTPDDLQEFDPSFSPEGM